MLFQLLPVPLCAMKVFMHVNGVQSQNPQSTPCSEYNSNTEKTSPKRLVGDTSLSI